MKGSAEGFNRIANEVFAPIYPVIAGRLLAWSGVRDGICLDIGSGPGLLAIALARAGGLPVCALDADPAMALIARKNIARASLDAQVMPVIGDVHRMPFGDSSIALIASRGSIYFWEDRPMAFREIERVLLPWGVAYAGGSFGTPELREQIFAEMRQRNPHWDEDVLRRSARADRKTLYAELEESGVSEFRVIEEEAGIWVEIRGQ
ncbi:MAG: class I SAM-dependent methyltransferase [Methanomicrobiaceae archaeon]|uniref:Methyltransferase, ubie/coq5 family n=1 Tax=hydrocarbon metagenome TaxID=938273 RepID=A0A0W8FJY5_9ZZZZ|nr:class I SAM-dependent methyltransferase [Methanomicrobiaceae archaeon]MDD5419231.1 class I SAM-dependent methyltransferase [Methanomicrobiaceae archaeon]